MRACQLLHLGEHFRQMRRVPAGATARSSLAKLRAFEPGLAQHPVDRRVPGGSDRGAVRQRAGGNEPALAIHHLEHLASVGPERGERGVERLGGEICVRITPTYTGCPATLAIRLAVETALIEAGLETARVETVLSPPWTTDDITEAGRAKLRAYGIAPPGRRRQGQGAGLFAEETVPCPRCNSTTTSRVSEFGSTACKALWRCETCREPFDYFKCL